MVEPAKKTSAASARSEPVRLVVSSALPPSEILKLLSTLQAGLATGSVNPDVTIDPSWLSSLPKSESENKAIKIVIDPTNKVAGSINSDTLFVSTTQVRDLLRSVVTNIRGTQKDIFEQLPAEKREELTASFNNLRNEGFSHKIEDLNNVITGLSEIESALQLAQSPRKEDASDPNKAQLKEGGAAEVSQTRTLETTNPPVEITDVKDALKAVTREANTLKDPAMFAFFKSQGIINSFDELKDLRALDPDGFSQIEAAYQVAVGSAIGQMSPEKWQTFKESSGNRFELFRLINKNLLLNESFGDEVTAFRQEWEKALPKTGNEKLDQEAEKRVAADIDKKAEDHERLLKKELDSPEFLKTIEKVDTTELSKTTATLEAAAQQLPTLLEQAGIKDPDQKALVLFAMKEAAQSGYNPAELDSLNAEKFQTLFRSEAPQGTNYEELATVLQRAWLKDGSFVNTNTQQALRNVQVKTDAVLALQKSGQTLENLTQAWELAERQTPKEHKQWLSQNTNHPLLPALREVHEDVIEVNEGLFREEAYELIPTNLDERRQLFVSLGLIQAGPTPSDDTPLHSFIEEGIEADRQYMGPGERLREAAEGIISPFNAARKLKRRSEQFRSGVSTAKNLASKASQQLKNLDRVTDAAFAAVPLPLPAKVKKYLALGAALAGGLLVHAGGIAALAGGIFGGLLGAFFGGGLFGGALGFLAGAGIGFGAQAIAGQVTNALGGLFGGGTGGGGLGGAEVGGASGGGAGGSLIIAKAGGIGPVAGGALGLGGGLLTWYMVSSYMLAFLPPDILSLSNLSGEYSKYVEIKKSVSPTSLENNAETPVTYTITIVPKDDYEITPVLAEVEDKFSLLGGEGTPPTSNIEAIRTQIGETPFNKSSPKSISYTIPLKGEDVFVNNTFSFAFKVAEEPDVQHLRATASVKIGNPKTGCFSFEPGGFVYPTPTHPRHVTSIEWKEDEKARFLEAYLKRMGTSASFNSLVCSSGILKVYRLPGSNYGGWAAGALNGAAIGIYDLGIRSPLSAEYTLVHELGHIIDMRNPTLRAQFLAIKRTGGCFTYPFPDDCTQFEGFAEAIALGVVHSFYPFKTGKYDFPSRNPAEYNWIIDNIYGGTEFKGATP